jgi:hypothetical protein
MNNQTIMLYDQEKLIEQMKNTSHSEKIRKPSDLRSSPIRKIHQSTIVSSDDDIEIII